MTVPFEVKYEDIEKLSDVQLTELLKKLLYLESEKFGLKARIDVSFKLNTTDGGDDGRVRWTGDIEKTDFIPGKFTIFQSKKRENLGSFSKSNCKSELIRSNGTVLPEIDTLFKANGSYVLFFSKACNIGRCQSSRIEGFRKGLSEASADYANTCDIQIYDANKIAEWSNKYLVTVRYVLGCVGKSIPYSAKTWNDLIALSAGKYSNTYFADQKRLDSINEIRKKFSINQNVTRIFGNSGLGKTRLVIEAFQPPKNTKKIVDDDERLQYENHLKFIYFDAEVNQNILHFIINCRENGLRGTFVVDNCDCRLHDKLVEEIRHRESKLSLITIDYADKCKKHHESFICIEKLEEDSIKKMIENLFPGLIEDDIAKIVKISEGYPQMAVLLAESRELGSTSASITNKDLISRLIHGRDEPSADRKKVITVCSLFSAFGFTGDVSSHEKYLAENICHMEHRDFHRILVETKRNQKIIESRGRFHFVTPKPLAITLASEWWEGCSIEEAKEILITDDLCNLELLDPLCEQFRFLKLEPQIEKLTEELCGVNEPFGQAETLNSVRGSRVFRSIAEVNPSAAINALEICFGVLSKDELNNVGPGRRSIIWTLENLCFWKEYFPKSARILLKFAVSETEPGLGNNATGIFNQLFHYLLSGTQAPPEIRLEVIQYGLANKDPDYHRVCLNALKHVLQTHHFSRIRGAEEQGIRYAEKEWTPKYWSEVYKYWDNALEMLTEYVLSDRPMRDLAKEIIQDSIDGLLFRGRLDSLEKTIITIHNEKEEFWPEILYSLKSFLNKYGAKIPAEGKERIEKWILEFEPKTFTEKLYTIVIKPEMWKVRESDNWIEESGEQIKNFAEEVAKDPTDLYNNLEYLYSQEGTSGHSFGYYLGEFLTDKKEFIDRSIFTIKNIEKNKQNLTILNGFIYSIEKQNPQLVADTLEIFAKDQELIHWLVPLTARKIVNKADLDRILPLLHEGKIDPSSIILFQYGSVLSDLSSSDLTEFLKEITEISMEYYSIIIDIVFMYTFKDDDKFRECIPFIQELISRKNCLQYLLSGEDARSDIYDFSELTKKLLNQNAPDFSSAKEIALRIIELCDDINGEFVHFIYSCGMEVTKEILSDRYVEEIWEIFSNAIIKGRNREYYSLSMLLGEKSTIISPEGNFSLGLIHIVPISFLIRSCKDYPDTIPEFLSKTMTPVMKDGDCYVWSDIAKYLIDNYGDKSEILDLIEINFGNYMWINSAKEYYQIIRSAFEELKSHDNYKVREWAEKNITIYDKKISFAESEEEEDELDIITPPRFY